MYSRSLFRSGLTQTFLRRNKTFSRKSIDRQERLLSAQAQAKLEDIPIDAEQISYENAIPYEKIPGLSKAGMIRAFLPGGMFHEKSIAEMVQVGMAKYGQVYKIPGLFGKPDMVTTTNPDDFALIYRNEGVWPIRRAFDIILYHRTVLRKDYYKDVIGLIWSNGEEWGKMRSAVNPILMNPKNVKLYFNSVQDVNSEFIQRIREIRNPETDEMPEDFENEILRLTFETVCSVALNRQLGLFHENRDDPRAAEMMSCVRKFLFDSFDLEILPPFWKIIKTKKFKEMMHVLDRLTEISESYIKEAWETIDKDKDGNLTTEIGREKSVLEKLARVNHKFAVVTAIDLLMAGVDTTSSTLTAILLCLSKNPEKQQLLFEEIKEILPQKHSEFTMDKLKNLPYLRACIKESMRLIPITSSTFRRMPKNVVLSGYQIPAGTDVVGGSIAYYNHPDFVPKAKEFIPERWLRSEKKRGELLGKLNQPFMYVPFGFGPRMCAGKRLVELELEINIARLIRNFDIQFHYPIDKAFKSRFIITPQIPLKFTFKERPN